MSSRLIKMLCLLITVTLLTGIVFTGCGGNTKKSADVSSTSTQDEKTDQESKQTEEQKKVTISWMTNAASCEQAYKNAIERFQKENPNITVNLELNRDYGAYNESLKAALASGQELDIFEMVNQVYEYSKAGYCADLSDLEFNKYYSENAKKITVINGKNYGFLAAWTVYPIWYNKDIFAELGIEPPTNFDEFKEVVEKCKKAGYGGLVYPGGSVQGYWLAMALNTVEMGTSGYESLLSDINSGKLKNLKEHEGAYAVLKTLAAYKPLLYENSSTIKTEQSYSLFAQKKAAMLFVGSFIMGNIETLLGGVNFGMFIPPTLNKGDTIYAEKGQTLAIYSKSKNLDAAKKFINFFAMPENYQQFCTEARQTPTVDGVVPEYPGSDSLNSLLKKVEILPNWESFSNQSVWFNMLMNTWANLLFKSGDVDKEIADLEELLKKADLK